jgi:predicted RND superfamily exporter protein
LLPVLVVLVTVTWTLGLFVMGGNQTNWVTSMIAPLLVLVGVADAVHFLAYYREVLPEAESRRDAILKTLDMVTLPCLYTSVTTAVGFASLMVNQVVPIRVFGIYTAIGILLAFFATLVLVPTALSLGRKRPKSGSAPSRAPLRPWPVLVGVDRLVRARPGLVLALSLALVLPIAFGAYFIRVETNLLRYFPDTARVVQDSEFIEGTYEGSSPLDIIIETPDIEGAYAPEVLQALDTLQDRIAARPEAARGVSLADLVKELHMVMSGEPERFRVPEDPALVSQLMLMASPETTEKMVDDEVRILRLGTRFQGAQLPLEDARALMEAIESDCADLFPEDVEVRLTGSSLLFINMDRYVFNGQVRSLGLVLAVLLVIMTFLFRSLRMGLLAMIPNAMPIAIMFGLLGWFGMPLDGFTAMMACIAIGIGVDDTVHFLHHLRVELDKGAELPEAISHTIRGVGRALVFTSVVLTLGFGIFCLASFLGTRNFGLLTAIAIVSALAADLLVLPSVLLLWGVPKSWRRRAEAE